MALFKVNLTTCKCPEKLKILFSMVEVKPPKIITEMSITARPIHILGSSNNMHNGTEAIAVGL